MNQLPKKRSIHPRDFIYVILKCAYAIIWFFFGAFLFLVFAFQDPLFTFILGKYANAIILVIGIFCCIIPLFLKSMKKRWIRYLVAYVILVSFIGLYRLASKKITNYVSVFTVEKWNEHTVFRNYMLDDLIENHGIIGMNKEDVLALLGQPDLENETHFSYYVDKEQREFIYIEVLFTDGKVASIKFIYLL